MSAIEEILIVANRGVKYGVNTEYIEQILRVPALTPVVLGPSSVRGLSAVSGSIVSSVDLSLLLGYEKIDIDDKDSRLLKLRDPFSHSALIIESVFSSVEIDQNNIEYLEDPNDAVVAIYKDQEDIIQILDFELLLANLKKSELSVKEVRSGSLKESDTSEEKLETQRFLLFLLEDEYYAIEVDHLREILTLPESFTSIAGTDKNILGMISLRDELLLVSDLRVLYGFDDTLNDKNRILVTQIAEKKLGLVVDAILDIRDYHQEDISTLPENFKDRHVSAVIHDSQQLVSVIGDDVLEIMMKKEERFVNEHRESENRDVEKDCAKEVVIFRLDSQEYALDIENVAEIIDMTDITTVADAADFIEGIINIRGQVISIASLFKLLHLPHRLSENQKILVCQSDRERIGFNVDDVTDVLGISEEEMKKEEDENSVFTHILHLDNGERLVMLIDIEKIFEDGASV